VKSLIAVEDIKKVSLAPNELLLIKLPEGSSLELMAKWRDAVQESLNSPNVLVYTSNKIEFLKIALEEKMINKLIDDELQK